MNNQEEYFEAYREKLYELLKHAVTNVPYYRNQWDFSLPAYEDFTYDYFNKQIPFLEKNSVRNNSREFLVDGIKEDELSIDTTSGTEGKPIVCIRSKKERLMCSSSLWRERRHFVKDLRPSDCGARFYAFRNKENQIIADEVLFKDNDILLPLFNLSDEKLIYYWNEIVKARPRWLHGPSSTIYNMALVVKNYKLEQYHFELIELSGEYVNPEHQRVIEEVFGCRTSNQYGCREYWPMAYSDVNGGLHVVTDNIYIEQIYNKEHNMNEIVITLLKNNSWPLIRYKLEDLGNYIFEDSQIKLTLNRGRKADFFVLKGNRRFNAIVFSGIARSICELYGSNVILQFQVQKINDDQLDVYLRMKDGDKKQEIVNRYKQEIQKILGEDVIINLYETDYIKPDPKTGKTKEFIG